MARIRSIHPGFFTDEAIVAASPQAQIFLIGVWTQCDDQGVFEWKPVTLKMRILPASNSDVTTLLGELVALGIVKQIDIGPLKYGLVRNFRKYQRPKKPNSTYPLPPEFRTYVGLTGPSTEPDDDEGGESSPPVAPEPPPVPHQGGTGSEIAPQMEEEGGRRKEGKEGDEESLAPPPVAEAAPAPEPVDDGLDIPEPLCGPAKPAGSRAAPIPRDWLPSEWAQAELAKGRPDLTPERIIDRTIEFRLWCAESNKQTHNPDATWLGFMRKTHVQQPRQNRQDPVDDAFATGVRQALAGRSV